MSKVLTLAEAEELTNESISEFRKESNREMLMDLVDRCNSERDPMKQFTMRMQLLMPKGLEILSDRLKKYGFNGTDGALSAMSQIAALSSRSQALAVRVAALTAAMSGDFGPVLDFDSESPVDETPEEEVE